MAAMPSPELTADELYELAEYNAARGLSYAQTANAVDEDARIVQLADVLGDWRLSRALVFQHLAEQADAAEAAEERTVHDPPAPRRRFKIGVSRQRFMPLVVEGPRRDDAA